MDDICRPTDPSRQYPAGNYTGPRAIIDLVANLKETLTIESGQPSKASVIDFCDRILLIVQELDKNTAAQDSPDVLREIFKGIKDLIYTTESYYKQIIIRLDRLNTV